MLGLRMPRLELLAGESVFVLLLVKYRFDMEHVAAEAGEPVELLRILRKRPAVDHAISNWRDYGRLPLAK
jgi:hypothetical protein